jgi:hypothetical protein
MTGCEFAKRLSGKAGRVAIELHVDAATPPTDWLNSAFDAHARSERIVIAVFPSVTTEETFVEFLNALGADGRWALRRRTKTSPSGGVLLGVEWTTTAGRGQPNHGVRAVSLDAGSSPVAVRRDRNVAGRKVESVPWARRDAHRETR